MWATWVLAASFTILILAGFEIVPQWSKPYPESAMFQALLVLMLGTGWLIGALPVAAAVYRGEMDWLADSKTTRWLLTLALYLLTASGAVWAIAMGTDRNAPYHWKAAALLAGLAVPLAYGFYLRWLLEPAWRPTLLHPHTVHQIAGAIFTLPAAAGAWACSQALRSVFKRLYAE